MLCILGIRQTIDECCSQRLNLVKNLLHFMHSIYIYEIQAEFQAIEPIEKLAINDTDSSFRVACLIYLSNGQLDEKVIIDNEAKGLHILVYHLSAYLRKQLHCTCFERVGLPICRHRTLLRAQIIHERPRNG